MSPTYTSSDTLVLKARCNLLGEIFIAHSMHYFVIIFPINPFNKKASSVQNKNEEPKLKKVVDAADGLSLGISIVVAVLMGVGIGIGLQKLTGAWWTIFIGMFIGIGAAISNVYKAYAKQKKVLDELAKDPRYSYKANQELQKKYDKEDDE